MIRISGRRLQVTQRSLGRRSTRACTPSVSWGSQCGPKIGAPDASAWSMLRLCAHFDPARGRGTQPSVATQQGQINQNHYHLTRVSHASSTIGTTGTVSSGRRVASGMCVSGAWSLIPCRSARTGARVVTSNTCHGCRC